MVARTKGSVAGERRRAGGRRLSGLDGKIGSIPLKDPKFRKIPLKAHEIEKYH
jgi:hypothetical protein